MKNITFGLDSFGNVSLDESGNPVSGAQVIRDVLAQGQLADELGLNNFNIGEHHRDDFAVTAPDTILAGLATTTKNIILGTGVTVLSSEDPVRVYQRFATIDALSNGRVQITAGRGSFIESFPLFGYELSDYNDLFEQKLELLVELLKEEPVTWSGSMRAGLSNQEVYPKTEGGKIPLRVGVGGSPESVLRAARLNIPMALAIIGGDPARFEPFARLYKETLAKLDMPELPVSVHSPGHVAENDDQAIEEAWPGYEASFGKIGLERGWGPTSKEHFLSEVYHGSMYVGSPETVAKKIVHALSSVGASRFDLKYDMGPLSHSKLTKSIELYATKVVPMVRDMLESA
jgi:probable LLM family oxidoreductase